MILDSNIDTNAGYFYYIKKMFHGDAGSTSGCGGLLKNFKRLSSLDIPGSPAS